MPAAFLFSAFGLQPSAAAAAPADTPPVAKFDISGLGLLGNRSMSRTMQDFVNPGKVAHLSDDAAENAAFVLISELEDDGYLHPKITGFVTRLDGTQTTFQFNETLDTAFPRKPGTNIVAFDVERGVKFYIAEVHFEGLNALEQKAATAFFKPAYGLWNGARANVFSEAAVRRGRNSLHDALLLRGYVTARVEVSSSALAKPAGAMRLDVKVSEGPRWIISSVQLLDTQKTDVDAAPLQKFVGEPWSEATRQDASVAARRAYYRKGYPDVSARTTPTPTPSTGDTQVAATVEVQPGPFIKIGEIRYEGNDRTRLSVIKRRVRLDPGDPLDPTALERARLRLGRLSAFSSVETSTEPATDDTRNVTFTLREADPWDASLLFGYGSYEQFRGGIEARRSNLWGRAHQDRIMVVQSMKSSRGDYTYTVPELFGETIDGSARLFGLRREEIAFDRVEYGGTAQLRKKIGVRGPELSGGYTLETLSDQNNTLGSESETSSDVLSSSINLGIAFDRRDQTLNPRKGYRLYLQTEYASQKLGGEVDFQRVEWGAAWHQPLSTDRWIHVGLAQAAVFTSGADPYTPPPVNKLYYPGGDNSLRGYSEGEASPRDADGSFLGAKTYTLLNIELEQALTQQWSTILFFDWLTESARLGDYPGDVQLSSIGLGLRYNTIVGPIRVEYARNLDPRPHDPGGSWHLSIGYPF
ncbi:BamA/OMP85 family outer membrane protein [Nibricoccus aquaticus]|uniref:BamA/OMP85 family outer membrane protein n=1 Tax=Nibricoccus aquaticus TaxID=2576891 RepID=UPI0015868F6F|nr:BamA/TamA family outer membrane protein [Nibricoccus aquaticus]